MDRTEFTWHLFFTTAILLLLAGFATHSATAQPAAAQGIVRITSKVCDSSGIPGHPFTYLSGQPITFRIAYSFSGFAPGAGPSAIQLVDVVPSPLIVTSVWSGSTANSASWIPSTGHTSTPVTIHIVHGLSPNKLSGTGTLEIHCYFPFDSTCSGTQACNGRVSIMDSVGTIGWSKEVIGAPSACVSDSAVNLWHVQKDYIQCEYDSTGSSILYHVTICNNPQGSYSSYGSLRLRAPSLTDFLPTGVTITSVLSGGDWTGYNNTTHSFTGGPAYLLPSHGCYSVYFKVKYPVAQYPQGTHVSNAVVLGYKNDCKPNDTLMVSQLASATICGSVNTGSLSKSLLMNLATPVYSGYAPTVSAGCCAAYQLNYRNQGTIAQQTITIDDLLPHEVQPTGGNIILAVPSGMSQADLYAYDAHCNLITTPIRSINSTTTPVTVPVSSTYRGLKWVFTTTGSNTGLAINGTISLNLPVCFLTQRWDCTSAAATGTTLLPGDIITNTATITSGSFTQTATNSVVVDPAAPRVIAQKFFLGTCGTNGAAPNGPWLNGDHVRYRIAVTNIGNADAIHNYITDVLPAGITYVPGSTRYALSTTTSFPGIDVNTPPCGNDTMQASNLLLGNYGLPSDASQTGNVLRWSNFTLPHECDGKIQWLVIDFDVAIDNTVLAGSYPNTIKDSAFNLPTPAISNVAWLTVSATTNTDATKMISLSPNGPWSYSANVPAGSTAYYRIQISNSGNTVAKNLCLLDIMPHTGDVPVLQPYIPGRGSAFNIVGASAATINSPLPVTQWTIGYTGAGNWNPSRSAIGFCGNVDPTTPAVTTGTFGSTVPTGGAAAIQLCAANTTVNLSPGQTLEVILPFTTVGATVGSQACNSFAYHLDAGGLLNSPVLCCDAESNTACVTAAIATGNTGGCCDTASFGPAAGTNFDLSTDWRSINVVNRKGTPIRSITMQYFDCSSNAISTSALALLQARNPHAVRNAPYLNRVIPATRFSKGYIADVNLPPDPTNANFVSFELGLPCSISPNCWSVRLLIEHVNPSSPTGVDTCYTTLTDWKPCPRIFPDPTIHVAKLPDSLIYAVAFTLDEGVPGTVGFVSIATADSTDTMLGATGGAWAGITGENDSTARNISSTEQSKQALLFHFVPDSTGSVHPTIHAFVASGGKHSQDRKYRPSLHICHYDRLGGLLSVDTIVATATVSSNITPHDAPAPETNALAIESITPNPAHTSIEVRYSLGASEQATLELIDALGLQVGVLADGYQTRGEHNASYIVSGLASGNYYLRLSTYNGQTSARVKVIH